MAHCGLLDRLLSEGRDIAFFANIDNTGAVFDERIAKVLADGITDYILEVTPRTPADVKVISKLDNPLNLNLNFRVAP